MTTYLVWNSGLKPCFSSWSLRKPGPNSGNVKNTQILKQQTAGESQGLNHKIVEEVVAGSRKIICEDCRNVGGVVDDSWYDIGHARRD